MIILYTDKEEVLSSAIVKIECLSDNENDNSFRTSAYSVHNDRSTDNKNTKLLVNSLKNDKSSKNWTACLSSIMPMETEKMLEGENLLRLQELFDQTEIITFNDFKTFLFNQCKQFDGSVEMLKEFNLYDILSVANVGKPPSTNKLFTDVAVIHKLDKKNANPHLKLLLSTAPKPIDTNMLQARRKSVLSHTTTSSVITTGAEQAASVACKKNKTKVSFLKQALYNEMNQDANDCETKHFLNGGAKTLLDSMEQIDSCPESPSNNIAVDSETCLSEDSTSTISSGTPHYNFRKSKRKTVEEDGFIESQVIKRMYRGRVAEDTEEKAELPKISNVKVQTSEQKLPPIEKKETNNRRISSRLKNNIVKNNQQLLNKSPQIESPPCRITSTRASLRRVSRKTT